jgi:2-methylcitrate dehydratase PrpD
VHAGWAAHGGILAAELAAAGGEGPAAVFEDRFGFFAAYYDGDAGALVTQVSDLGRRWETPRIAFKPYPACHFVHSCLDAAASLRAWHAISADDVERITVAVPDPGVPLVLEPSDAKRDPRTEYDAKFSLQYSIAALLVHGSVGVETYTMQAIREPAVLALAARVEHLQRAFPTYPRSFPGWVRIETRAGAVHELELEHQRGGPENPMSVDEVTAKFRANAAVALDTASIDELQASLLSLDEQDDLTRTFAPLRTPLPAMQHR